MTTQTTGTDLTEEGMHFFGRMSASATHEIKNTLAIINENVGLMEDMAMVAQDGMLSFEKVKGIAESIKTQVQRSNKIVKKLNTFSHTTDLPSQAVDLEQMVRQTLDVASRLIDMYQATIDITPPSSPVNVSTNPFFFQNLIWRATEATLNISESPKKLEILFGKNGHPASIWFAYQPEKILQAARFLTDKEDKVVMDYLGATLQTDEKNNRLGLIWTQDS